MIRRRVGDHDEIFVTRCHCWSCSYCQPRMIAKLRRTILSGRPNRFITLTSSPHVGESPTDRAKILKGAVNVLFKRVRRTWPHREFQCFFVMEMTKRGEPHIHILMRGAFIPQKWLSKNWEQLTGAKIVDVRKIKNGRAAAAYVTKYISKAPARYGTMKRYWSTKRWRVAPEEEPVEERPRGRIEEIPKLDFAIVLAAYRAAGCELVAHGRGYLKFLRPDNGGIDPLAGLGREAPPLARPSYRKLSQGPPGDTVRAA